MPDKEKHVAISGADGAPSAERQVQLEAMIAFLDATADHATLLRGRMPSGIARDFADEIIDLIVDAKIDLQENQRVLFAGVVKPKPTRKEDHE